MRTERDWKRREFLQLGGAAAAAVIAGSEARGQDADAVSDSRPWQLGCFTRPFGNHSFAETIAGIAQAGYRGIGLMTIHLPGGSFSLANASAEQAATVASMTRDHQLSVLTTYYAGPPVEQSLQQGVAGMRKLIDNCVTAGCAAVLLGGTTEERLYDTYYQAVAELCDYAAERKVLLNLKPHGGLNATGPQCRQAIERVGHPGFNLWYDPGNIFYYSDGSLDPVDDAASVNGLVTGMCVKDFQPPKDVELNPGSGKVAFPRVLQILRAGGFSGGPLVVETLAPGDLPTTIENARRTREQLQQWLKPV